MKALYPHNISVSYYGPEHLPPLPSAQLANLLSDVKSVCPVKHLIDAFTNMAGNSASIYLYIAEIFPTHTMVLSRDEINTLVG
ncbi:pyrethroid hydrolase Ces2a [Biomphalaria pfeifferi]|uniref:Pyrethroid hydrolase Ces2a n=1 Tax=Biomphalaria pfeifferi TaxID=112525 RepID=A0AAD8F4J5_BIOPF|nr:pyrethroid hydrolase Ces2a [Biomphalaria pfeifferi]